MLILNRIYNNKSVMAGFFLVACIFLNGETIKAEEPPKPVCPAKKPSIPKISLQDVYAKSPFKAGEKATYEVSYMGMLAGYGTLEVGKPTKQKIGNDLVYHRFFKVDAKTGDWYKAIFVAQDKVMVYSRPWDFSVSQFYIEQDEGKIFSSRYIRKKWLTFQQEDCKVSEKVWQPDKPMDEKSFDIDYGSQDVLGVAYWLRTRDYKIGHTEKTMVYSSEKNWVFEANPIVQEKIQVRAGTFDTMKLKLQTYIGRELQQKGDVYVWIANDTYRTMVQVQGEIKIGSVWIKLHNFVPGK